MKKYLLLGGNGYLGKYLTERLAIQNKVVVADKNIERCVNAGNIEYKSIDFINCMNFSEYLSGIDVVIHLVSTVVPSDNIDSIDQEISDNVFPTLRLLRDMSKNNIGKIVFLSSGGTVYGEHDETPIKENEDKRPICNYGIIKETIEKYLELYSNYQNLNYNVIRLSNPYSEKVKNGRKQGIIPIVIDQIIKGDTIKIWGDGNDIRDYIYIDDAIDAIINILNYEGKEKVFNVGTGKGYSINQLLEIISESLKDYKLNVEYLNSRKCDVNNNILDITRINQETGWFPKVSLEDGIDLVIKEKMKEEDELYAC